MAENKRSIIQELRGLASVIVQASIDTTSVVEEMHQTIGGGPALLGQPLRPLVKLTSGPIYSGIRGVMGFVGIGLDRAFAELEPVFGPGVPPAEYDMVRGALNGVFGDHLAKTQNPLAIQMELRHQGKTLDLEQLPDVGGFLVYLHGAAMDDSQLTRNGHNHGEDLARQWGLMPITVRYNSGLHISKNGRLFAELLQELFSAHNVPEDAPLVILGFSMGGLVARSAVHIAEIENLEWRKHLRTMIFLGTPHHGAPLERMGNLFHSLLGISRYSAPIGKLARLRSAGVTDLRFGSFLDEHWQGIDRFQSGKDPRTFCGLPNGVPCYAIAGSLHATEKTMDGLVPVPSALGQHDNPALALDFPAEHQCVVYGKGHLDLLDSLDAFEFMSGISRGRIEDK